MSGIAIHVLWFDDDIVELRVVAATSEFKAQSDVYVDRNHSLEIAEALAGFPAHQGDVREVILGSFEPDTAGGGACLRFVCRDAAGHSYVRIKLVTDKRNSPDEEPCMANFVLGIEAATVDTFIQQLKGLRLQKGSMIELQAKEA